MPGSVTYLSLRPYPNRLSCQVSRSSSRSVSGPSPGCSEYPPFSRARLAPGRYTEIVRFLCQIFSDCSNSHQPRITCDCQVVWPPRGSLLRETSLSSCSVGFGRLDLLGLSASICTVRIGWGVRTKFWSTSWKWPSATLIVGAHVFACIRQ